ncbi:MAG: type IV secretory system conjugative DNA transfer family protein [Candidatus Melainabacteria bacterium]|jgi:type IV secretory pathway TraG/TraD family ATPase VirD4|nr:type IV secretory system conjugative DNA transfer family protein [Candidatus Melainabacteria bacterium]
MQTTAQDMGIVDTTPKELPVLAVNVLDRLGYQVSRASKQLDQILAVERLDEQVGRDWWRHEYRVVLRWSETSTGGSLVDVEISEKKGGGTQEDCRRRCEQVIVKLQEDAQRAKRVSATKSKSTIHGGATWGDENELRKAGYITNKPEATRLIIGKTQNKEYISVPELVTNAHAIVCGRTGVGKSRGFFIPNLMERLGTNMIVTEATPGYEPGELYTLTSGWRKQAGHRIYSFNPADMSSTRINPVDRVRMAPQLEKAKEAEKLADLIIMNGSGEEQRVDPTWDRSEKQLLVSLILHAAAAEPEMGHIGAIRWLLLSGINRVRETLAKSKSELAQMEFEGWLGSTSENFRFGVLSGLMTKLNPWITDQLVALTEKTDIDFEELRNQLFTFYIAVPSRSRDSKLIGSLLVNFLLDYLLDTKATMKYPTAMFLDEFTNFGKIANIANVLSIVRKAKISLVLGFQNYFQLERVYSQKEAQIIFDQPATQIYFRQKNFREARALSEALGRTTIEEVTVNDTGRVHEFIQGRALATPDELINLSGEVIAFTNDTWPLKLPLTTPYAYEHAMAYPPPERPAHEITEHVRRRGRTNEQQPQQQATNNATENQSGGTSRNRKNKDRNNGRDDRKRDNRGGNNDRDYRNRNSSAGNTHEDRPHEDQSSYSQQQDNSPEVDDVWPS